MGILSFFFSPGQPELRATGAIEPDALRGRGLFLLLGILVALLSLEARAAIGTQQLRMLRHLSALVVNVWMSMDLAVL